MPTKRGLGYQPDRHDPRDVAYAPPLAANRLMPAHISLRLFVTVMDQGDTSSCVAHAFSQAILVHERKQGIIDAEQPSPIFGYYNSRRMDTNSVLVADAGTYLRSYAAALFKFGCCDEKVWSFSEHWLKVNRRPSFDAYMHAHGRRGGQYTRIVGNGPARIHAVKSALAAGLPVVFGTNVGVSFLENEGPSIVAPPVHERSAGGHAMCLVGYDETGPNGTLYEVVNSWSTSWRDDGLWFMTEDYLTWDQTADLWIIQGWEAVRKS